ncbi:GH39 family glycosyl hydrolase [Metabacillus niabensis]|uniref:Glycosyl hydrolases family 39 N-terminal catalytic domain-containing protein n=1 Tax=Metabacillus niabensis TaxID=324854 RepID=A0ABT9Z6A6_9BACI|nr:glycosyl hydrolase [Metabacillus niabensis]MDQ0226820.1 hypothetical protein [Metabacillus niabensis]
MKLKLYFFIKVIVVLFLLVGCGTAKVEVVESSFFGMHVRDINTPTHNLGYGAVRLWDTKTNWRHIEKQKGNFDFNRLDNLVNNAVKQNQDILLTLGQPPNWSTDGKSSSNYGENYNSIPPRDIEDWKSFVKVLGERYKGKIKYYEIWNEPNLNDFYSGSINELVTLTKEANHILKSIDSEIKIVSPSPTGKTMGVEFLDQFLESGGGKYVDIIGVHLYVYPSEPEEMISLISKYKNIMKKNNVEDLPIWNTEFTWVKYNSNGKLIESKQMPDKLGASYLSRSLLLNIGMRVERAYFYGLDYPASKIRLINLENQSNLLLPGEVYKNIISRLLGAQILDFKYKNEVYVLSFISSKGKKGLALWTTNTKVKYNLPSEFIKGESYSVIGKKVPINGKSINLTDMPIFIYEE